MFSSDRLSRGVTPRIRVVYPQLTNSNGRPVNGWPSTTDVGAGERFAGLPHRLFTERACVLEPEAFARLVQRDQPIDQTLDRRRQASYAAIVDDQIVSPPLLGMTSGRRIAKSGMTVLNE